MKYGWLLDTKRCIECSACEVACKQWNQVETGVNVRLRRLRVVETGTFPNARVSAISLSCNHCENALCMKACPAKAIWRRDDGLVIVNREKCLGCGQCRQFCPYEAPQMNQRTRQMEKCTGCFVRVEAELRPACATMCPTGALQWGKWQELSGQGTDRIEGFQSPTLTRPAIRFVTAPWGKQ